jgi:hypothetical protein
MDTLHLYATKFFQSESSAAGRLEPESLSKRKEIKDLILFLLIWVRLLSKLFLNQNLVYILREREHALFQRQGDDLIYKAKIPLGQALVGCAVEVATLDGRLLTIPINDIGKRLTRKMTLSSP